MSWSTDLEIMKQAVRDECARARRKHDLYDHQRAVNDAINTKGFTALHVGDITDDEVEYVRDLERVAQDELGEDV